MCSGLFDTLPLNELTCMGSKGSLFSLSKMQLENATALFVVEVYCSRAKKKGCFEVWINPLSPKSDQHKISPCKYQCFVKQRGHENYGLDHTRWICLIFINFPPTTPAGDEKGQQITISILIVGFKGLSSAAEWTHYGLRTRYSQLLLCVKSHYGSCLSTPRYYRQQLPSKKTDVWMKKKRNRYWGYRHFW